MFDSCISSRFLCRDKLRYSCQISAGCLDHCCIKAMWQIEAHQIPRGQVEEIQSLMWRQLVFGRLKTIGVYFRSF